MADNCPSCGHWTQEGLAKLAERSRANPIYRTNLQRPKSEVIREIRNRITDIRGAISDFQFAFPGWKERTEPVEGLLTCGIVTLYGVVEELEKSEREQEAPNFQGQGREPQRGEASPAPQSCAATGKDKEQ